MSDTGSLTLGLALVAGLASVLSWCVVPLVPGCVSHVAGTTLGALAADDRARATRRAAVHAALVVLGFALVFVALGAAATALGSSVRRSLPLLQRVGGIVVAAFGLYLAGAPQALRARARRLHVAPAIAGTGSVVAGIAFGAGWTPCIGPVLASILLLAGTPETMHRGSVLLVAYTLGLVLPLFAAAFLFARALVGSRAARHWARPMERVAGGVLVVVGALLATGRFTAISSFLAGFGQLVTLGS